MHTIIVADRAPVTIEGLKSIINEMPEVNFVGSAQTESQLYKQLNQKTSDTLIYDPRLPGKNYIEQLKYLLVSYPNLKIIVFTDYMVEELIRGLIQIGAHGVLSKSAEPEEIDNAIHVIHRDMIYLDQRQRFSNNAQTLLSQKNKDIFESEDVKFLRSFKLTNREREVLTLVAQGLKNREIAQQLYISKRTVETHRENIMRKLRLDNSTQMIRFAFTMGYA